MSERTITVEIGELPSGFFPHVGEMARKAQEAVEAELRRQLIDYYSNTDKSWTELLGDTNA